MPDLVVIFVNGKVQNRINDISKAMQEFFSYNQPIIEQVYLGVKLFEKKTIANLNADEAYDYMRKDLEGARKGLNAYNRIFGRVDNQLAIMSSNFNLRQFLEENGFAGDKIREFQYELNEYWDVTYGDLIKSWGLIRNKLEELRNILDQEVKMLETLPSNSYFQGIKENADLMNLFLKERDLFYDIMRLYEATNNVLFRQTVAKLEVQISKSKAEFEALMHCIKKNYTHDLDAAKTRSQKSLIILLYLFGAFGVLKRAKKSVITTGAKKVFSILLTKSYAKLNKKSDSLVNASREAEGIFTDASAEALMRNVQAVYSAIA